MSKEDLSVKERLLLLFVVPPIGNVTQLEIIRVFRESLSFNAELQERLKFVENEEAGSTVWNDKAEAELGPWSFEFNRVIRKIVEKALRITLTRMSQQELITDDHLSLGKRFIPDYDDFYDGLKKDEIKRADEAEVEEERAAKLAKEVKAKKRAKEKAESIAKKRKANGKGAKTKRFEAELALYEADQADEAGEADNI